MEAPIEDRLRTTAQWLYYPDNRKLDASEDMLRKLLLEAADTIEVLLGQRKILVEEKINGDSQPSLPSV